MTKALITIDDDLWMKARLHNVKHGLTVNQLITAALTDYLGTFTFETLQTVAKNDLPPLQAGTLFVAGKPVLKPTPRTLEFRPAPKPTKRGK